jgi:hypothetical protein
MAKKREVKCYKYLGITLQTSGKTFNLHIKETAPSTIHAMPDIQSLSKLLLERSMKLLDVKTVPFLIYSLEILWECLGENGLKTTESVKPTYLKKAPSVSRYTSSWLICSHKRKSAGKRPAIQAPSAIQQYSKQINHTKTNEGE